MIERSAWKDVAFYIYATAGVRSLGDEIADELWSAVRAWSSGADSCPFRLVEARTLSGIEEAMFGFLSVNYGNFENPNAFMGSLDLGGVSSEIAFLPPVPSLGNSNVEMRLPSDDARIHIYAHSFMRFGSRDAFYRTSFSDGR